MSAFILSNFKFLEVVSENGSIKAKISEEDGWFLWLDRAVYTQDELQIHGLIKVAELELENNSSKRLRKNIQQLTNAFDAIRNIKIKNNIKLDVSLK